jgi:hypothetical protein
MLRIFIGLDPRQPLAVQVLTFSIYSRSSQPVAITPLILPQLPITRRGLTDFTFTRYLCPWLCGFEGKSIFIDADMLCLCDINELIELSGSSAVSVVKNKQRFEWPSLMVFNNELCEGLTPEYIQTGEPSTFNWAEEVGELPAEYNHIIPYDSPNPNAKICHFTAGVPCWPETRDCEYADAWREEAKACMSTVSFQALMGNSVHNTPEVLRMLKP